MVPPLNIRLEVRQKFVGIHKLIIRLVLSPMSVVALPTLIVIPEHTNLVDDICQAILERMLRSGQRPEKTPNDKIRKPVFGEYDPVSEQLNGLHVGDYTNTCPVLSITPTSIPRGSSSKLSKVDVAQR
jgi:hypothetical protein